MIMIAGVLNTLYGIAAIDKANFFVNDAKYVFADLATFGWFVLVLGVVQFFAAFAIWRGTPWGRWFGVACASVNVILQMLWIPAAPVLAHDDPGARHHRRSTACSRTAGGAGRRSSHGRARKPAPPAESRDGIACAACRRCARRCGSQPDELARLLADRGPAEAAAERLRGPPAAARRHRDELARRPARRVDAARGRRRGRGGARRRPRALRPADRPRGRRDRPQPHRRHGLLDDDARARARGRRRDRARLRHRQRRRARDRRGGGVVRLHRQPHRRAAAAGADRDRARRGPRPAGRDPRARGGGARPPRPADRGAATGSSS